MCLTLVKITLMARYDLFLNRDVPLPDIFQYNEVPKRFKNQFIHFWEKFIRQSQIDRGAKDELFSLVNRTLCIELGEASLHPTIRDKESEFNFTFRNTEELRMQLSMIELYLRMSESIQKLAYQYHWQLDYTSDDLIEDVNYRFKENGVGYYYTNNRIIRVDSNFLHEQALKITLHLLSDPAFKNVQDEFLLAHEHFRFDRNGESLNECLKAFESTMKIICGLKEYPFKATDSSSILIQVLFSNNFIPPYLNNATTSLRQLLVSSIPTIRNKNSGHGKGMNEIEIPSHLVAYSLNMTGSTIRYLVEQYNKTK